MLPIRDQVYFPHMIFPLLVGRERSVRALEEDVVRSPRDGDIGALFGIGFPAFRGGPFRALDAAGAGAAVEILERFSADYGDRFAPAPFLRDVPGRRPTGYEIEWRAEGRAMHFWQYRRRAG